jgi:malonyl-CoA decarboxylase
MPQEPLIFVEIALTSGIPGNIGELLSEARTPIDPRSADTAVFYSISNTQVGLRGISFGNFLIKQVVEEINREMPKLATFVTLSPVTNFASWLKRERALESSSALTEADKSALAALDEPGWWYDTGKTEALRDPLMRAAAFYYLRARTERGLPLDAVARFHLGNGARLERINWLADTSDKAMALSHGLMVNYLYDLDDIEKNHEAYAEGRTVVASNAVQRLVRAPLELVPIAG